jgi:AraC family transcriptional activator FtrA
MRAFMSMVFSWAGLGCAGMARDGLQRGHGTLPAFLLEWQKSHSVVISCHMHFGLFLPHTFYSGVASAIAEILQLVGEVDPRSGITWEYLSPRRRAVSKIGTTFPARTMPSRRLDVLILHAGAAPEIPETMELLAAQSRQARPYLRRAARDGAIVAGTCSAAYFMADAGLLDGRRATVTWWLKHQMKQRFPAVKWEPSRLVTRAGRYYTSGAGFAGLELLSALLCDLGFAAQERRVRRLLVLPPSRGSQTPYEPRPIASRDPFEAKLQKIAQQDLGALNVSGLKRALGVSLRTLARQFGERVHTTPHKWIQQQRIETAKEMLHATSLNIGEIGQRVGYRDLPSFTRVFTRTVGMPPGEYRRQLVG